MKNLPPYEKIDFEHAVRILHFCFAYNPKMLMECLGDLITYHDTPYMAIAPGWYESYKLNIIENKKSK